MTLCFIIRTKMGTTTQIVATTLCSTLQEGDELTSLDGKDVKDLKEPELLEALQSQRPLKFLGTKRWIRRIFFVWPAAYNAWPFWEYWTSPYSSHLVDHIPNGWVMFNGDIQWPMSCLFFFFIQFFLGSSGIALTHHVYQSVSLDLVECHRISALKHHQCHRVLHGGWAS